MGTFEPYEYYLREKEKWKKEVKALKKLNSRISLFRLFSFVAFFVFLYFFATYSNTIFLASFLIFAGLFIFLIVYNKRLINKKLLAESYIFIYQRELQIMKNEFDNLPDAKDFLIANGNLYEDLDIFGKGSLYQYINRTFSFNGATLLADILIKPAREKVAILNKQQAVMELADKKKWRENFTAIGAMMKDSKYVIDDLQKWLEEKALFKSSFLRFLTYLIPAFSICMLVLLSCSLISFGVFLFYIFFNLSIVGYRFKDINKLHSTLSRKNELLQSYNKLFLEIEEAPFQSLLLKEKQAVFLRGTSSASRSLQQLSKILKSFDFRLNIIVGFLLNAMFIWDILQLRRLDKWKKENNDLLAWFYCLSEIEVLNSFAFHNHNAVHSCIPDITDRDFIIKADDLAHPLISHDKRIGNGVYLKKDSDFIILTGANMAGKSTFLRTIGLNMILAMNGAAVIASEMCFTPVRLVSSMRTSDSLFKNESYFYAELKKLKSIVDICQSGENVLILMDEILKGTNSEDKRMGSYEFIKRLIMLGGSGIIATHDISLGSLEKDFPDNIRNSCFEVDIKDKQLIFDYKLKDGIATTMNATFLMKDIGII